MAVYQISKIQIRRGKARTGPGFPQLASGELGWAVDSQELYIGNGSVAEGAPLVGNTKILTFRDLSADSGSGSNFTSILQHRYRSTDSTIMTGTSVNDPKSRSFQDVLDDNAYTTSFGAAGDGTTDDTAAIQRAIDQLFANSHTESFVDSITGIRQRVTLKVPAGKFVISSTLFIPSFATIVGAGIDKSIFQYNGTGTAFQLKSDNNSYTTSSRPRYINISGITIKSVQLATIGLDLTNASYCTVNDVKLVGQWTSGTATTNKGLMLDNTQYTSFNNIIINAFYYGVYANDSVLNIVYNNSTINSTYIGIALGLGLDNTHSGVTNLHISNCNFTTISANAVVSDTGSSNSISSCTFINVGGGNTSPLFPQLYFIKPNFTCVDIKSDRSNVLSDTDSILTYIPEVSGKGAYSSAVFVTTLSTTAVSLPIIRIPLRTNQSGIINGTISYIINYVFSGASNIREGTISITANSNSIVSADEYVCNTPITTGINLSFTVSIDTSYSIKLSYINQLEVGTLTYSYTSNF